MLYQKATSILDTIAHDYYSWSYDSLYLCLEILYTSLLQTPLRGKPVGSNEHRDLLDRFYAMFVAKLKVNGESLDSNLINET